MFWGWAIFGGLLGGAVVTIVQARRTGARLAARGEEHAQRLRDAGAMTEREIRALAEQYVADLRAVAEERIQRTAHDAVQHVLVNEYGITPELQRDLDRLAQRFRGRT